MIISNGTTVAVMDGENLRLFRNHGHEPKLELAERPAPHLQVENVGSGGRHHSTSANPDRTRLREDDFAAAAVTFLNDEVLADKIERLVIVADPRTLGEMRRHFHGALLERLAGEITKNLTGFSIKSIERALHEA